VREFVLTDAGAELVDVYVGPEGVLTGSARVSQMSQERLLESGRVNEADRRRQELAQRAAAVEAQVKALQAQLHAESREFERFLESADAEQTSDTHVRTTMARGRSGDLHDLARPEADDE
jgi:circadian clock protein KaiC